MNDRPVKTDLTLSLPPERPELRCVACGIAFEFSAGDAPLVLRHVAYGYDFVHDGACLTAACQRLFAEPGYDCPAFARDAERRRVLGVTPAEGWVAVLANAPESSVAGRHLRSEPLRCWALVEHQDGSTSLEGLVRDDEWLHEPGGAEFPEAARGPRALVGYTSATAGPRHPGARAA